MKNFLSDLLISEVAEVAGASQDSIANWIRYSHLTAPPIHGKHRRFDSLHTVEVIIMQRLVNIGIIAAIAGDIAVRTAPSVLQNYVEGWAEPRGDEIAMGVRWVLVARLSPEFTPQVPLIDLGRAEAFANFPPGDWLTVELAPLIGGALTRALALPRNRGSRPQPEARE